MRKLSLLQIPSITLLVAVLLSGCGNPGGDLNGSPYNPPRQAPELDLQTVSGENFKLSDLEGDIVLVYFGYTYCPDICPTTLAEVKLIFEELADQDEDLHLIMVTVDPERDTPEVLEDYMDRFHPRFIGLWGQGENLERIMASYAVYAEKEPSDDPERYLVSHTARLFVIDAQGMLRTNYSFGTPREDILADIQLLLGEKARK